MSQKSESADKERLGFEAALARLEQIVHQLESGDVKLEESIALYEEGMKLKALCERILETARLKVEKITLAADGAAKLSKFDEK